MTQKTNEARLHPDRINLLADIAEMYYLENKNQTEIAKVVGVTRSMISRMLTEARQRNIVNIRIIRPIMSEASLEADLVKRFGLTSAMVISRRRGDPDYRLDELGKAAAQVLLRNLAPGAVLGLAWGTSISATVDAVESQEIIPLKVIQLVGALGARNHEYDGHALVQRLADKLGGESYFLNAPYICPNPEMVAALLETQSIQETVKLGKQAQIALLGIGSTHPDYSSYYLAGHVSLEELDNIRDSGAVGDVAGIHYDAQGNVVNDSFYSRLMTIRREDLLSIPVRLGVAGGDGKVEAILGALRGKLVNILVTDSVTAKNILDKDLSLETENTT